MRSNKSKFIVFISGAIFISLIYVVAWSPLFTVKSIEIIGSPTDAVKNEIAKSSGITPGQQLARVDPRSISHRLNEFAWISHVGVSRNWISGKVTMEIAARRPVALFNGRTIDSTGQLFDFPGSVERGLPIVSGATTESGLGAIALFKGLPVDFRDQIQSLSAMTDTTYLIRILNKSREIKVIWGSNDGAADISLKIKVFKALIERPENQKISRIDLSAPHAPIVK